MTLFLPQMAMKTILKALRVHGLPWWIFDYKSCEESFELRLHFTSLLKENLLQWCWVSRIHTSDSALAQVLINLKKPFIHYYGCSACRRLQQTNSSKVSAAFFNAHHSHRCAKMAFHSHVCLWLMEKPTALLSSSQGLTHWEQASRILEDSGRTATAWKWPLISSCLHLNRLQP